ncbi:hypothetical protein KPL76_05785 [Subtercola sp. PAMC28395]|uniref:sensor histidine kinase n=1 Tax=Subtercola sp. PAMC28395 TaxID=2846775 RepID=UPI001C0BB22B|nr:ATP-binding protein [Subtercola sp. PAMC28395]QWT24868.1 hypothetical protein KPL76_05785 [Subtercola sp. PAMC28395]
MSLVLPIDVEGYTTSRALGKASIWVSSILLAATLVLVISFKLALPQADIAISIAGLGLVAVGVWLSLRATNTLLIALFLLAAAIGLFLYTFEIASELVGGYKSDSLLFTFPKIAITVVGVAGRTLGGAIGRCTVGFVLASVAVVVAATTAGLRFAFDFTAIGMYVALLLLLAALWLGRREAQRGSSTMKAAGEAEERMVERSRISSRASAALHDTVLNDLHALTLTAPGRLQEAHRAFLARDIAALAHPALLVDEAMLKVRAGGDALVSSGMAPIIQSAKVRGLAVTLSGDADILLGLDSDTLIEITRAVDQALINVSKHAHVDSAEVAFVAGVDTINVVVTDAGTGFDPAQVDDQRLGLAVSIRQRIETIGGSVRVWSTPGSGTAVLLSIPFAGSGALR